MITINFYYTSPDLLFKYAHTVEEHLAAILTEFDPSLDSKIDLDFAWIHFASATPYDGKMRIVIDLYRYSLSELRLQTLSLNIRQEIIRGSLLPNGVHQDHISVIASCHELAGIANNH